jgi:DNA repair exonuclease SbcCD ATPase subunit
MRLLRLRLANYRGIEESEVEFGSSGLTVVEGPNEAGKTSLGESIRLLFDYPASSKSNSVMEVKPVTRDVGSEIELEMESGKYRFTYFKRFHRKPETVLTVTKPNVENHTGRDAHDRAVEILRETIDVDLWNALNIHQGEAVQQANLSRQTSLSAALDNVAGGHAADPREDSVFEKVCEEYERYYTKTGKEKKELQESTNALDESESEVESLRSRIRKLGGDIVRAAELDKDLERLNRHENNLRKDVSKYKKSLEEITRLENDLETAGLKFESAQKSQQTAKRNLDERRELIEQIATARSVFSKLEKSSSSSIDSLRDAEDTLEKAQSDTTKAENARREAESLRDLYRADYDYFHDKLDLELMRERKNRIDSAKEESAMATELLKRNRVDDGALKSIKKAESAFITAKAKLDTGAPNVLLRGLADLEYLIDGKPVKISLDEEAGYSVSDRLSVTIPGSLQIEVTAGSSASELLEEVRKAEEKLDALCSEVGVSSADEARQSNDARREAQKTVDREIEIEKENLRDLDYEELERRVFVLEKRVPAYPGNRSSESELPEDLESAQGELQDAEIVLEKTGRVWEDAKAQLELSRKVRDELRERHREVRVQLDLKGDELNRAEGKLAGFRKTVSDEDLEADHSKLSKLAEEEEINAKSAARLLRGQNPDQVKTLAETARGSLQTVMDELDNLKEEQIEVRTRLKVHGEEGLHEKLHAAQTHLDHVKRENEAMIRRADAARLLHTIMKEERDKARLTYVAPLKEKIERLGRLVFNNTFKVEIDENLTVASRVLDGSQVPFTSLSGGTREQISLISRLACAMTVSENGGAPLILDDALGNTDPERLKLMGAVLAKAGKECQIIILTCVPERYCNVGEATVVRL